jgi:hypothetical protein
MLVDESLAIRIAMDLRQAGLFASVFEPIDLHRAPVRAARLGLALETQDDPHTPATQAKAFATGLSLFLLAPAFRYGFDAEARVEARLRSCDGWSKRFEGRASGSLRYDLFAGEDHSDWALRAGVLERALGAALAELAADAELRERLGAGAGEACAAVARP